MTLNINSTVTGNYGVPTFKILTANTDGVQEGEKDTEWQNTKFTEQWGAFVNIAEYQNALLMKAIWNTGKGWTSDALTQAILEHVTGWGKDTFDDIIYNQDVTSYAAGDSYAQIIKEEDTLVNLKPLNPGTIKHIVRPDGRIREYVQVARNGSNQVYKKFKPEEIFHLSYNHLADSTHGISIYDKLKPIIQADEASFAQMQKVMTYQSQPFILWKLKTDDVAKINTFVAKVKSARKLGDDLFIPDDENIAQWEIVQISPSQLIMLWRDDLRNKFYRAVGLPQIVPGGGEKGTGSESRTIYLAFEQLVAQRQLYLQKQIEAQLGLKIRFNPPTTMAELIGNTESKTNEMSMQMSELNPTAERQ